MTMRNRAITLIVLQCLLVSSIAVKYLYERATCPRVWTRAAQYDPELPMRGRYLSFSPEVDVCGLKPRNESNFKGSWFKSYRVQLAAREGKLVAEDARDRLPRGDYPMATASNRNPCERAPLSPGIDYFIPENAKSPFPLKPGQELWVEVTVPPHGPPRAIQLALSENGKWQTLQFE
ncbi:MAG TPA: hypothetical protein VMU45_10320 [Candidatus Eisenbacteria bacterium]|nr:hypothetical protein [Candidatus Eisenbacteria bacterium]